MIFGYCRASLQNSLSPGTKRHTKDGVQPAACEMLPHLGNTKPPAGAGGGPSWDARLPTLPLPLTADCAPVQVSPTTPFRSATPRPLHGAALWGEGQMWGDLQKSQGERRKTGLECVENKVQREISHFACISTISSAALNSKSPGSCFTCCFVWVLLFNFLI